jgi:outer membrane receptor protein involved in Fe transport
MGQWLRMSFLTGLAASATFAGQLALAQTAVTSQIGTTAAKVDDALAEIVVTGTPIAQKILDTSFAITVIDPETLKNSPAIGLAALLQHVPGMYGEASAGEENLNISPRGVRGGFLTYISLQEDGLPIFYNGFLEELEFRPDLYTDRVEITRGGPSGVLTSNGAGAIVNFISRKASDKPEGDASLSYYSFGQARVDFFYGTPLGNAGTTSATIGGYWRSGDGAKNVGFDVNHGGQIRANITHAIDNGEISLSYKIVDDHTQFYLPQPVKITQNGTIQRITPIPGFDAMSAYLQGPQTQNISLKTPNGTNQNINLGDGIYEHSNTITLQAKYDWQNGLTWKDSLRFANIQTVDNDLRNLGGNDQIQDANTFLATSPLVANLIATFAPQGAVGAKLVQVATGNTIANPAAMNGNGLLTQMGANQFIQDINEVINDSQFNFTIDNNVTTLGLLTWDQHMHVSQNAVDFLMDVTNHANLLDVAAVNAAGQTVGHLTNNGVLSYDDGYANGTVGVLSNSVYLNDQFHPIEPLRLDAGVRYEKVQYRNTSENSVSNVPLSGVVNPNVLADAVASGYGDGTYTAGKKSLSGTAWTAGANYELTNHLAFYGRFASSFDTGIANFAVFCAGAGCYSPVTRLNFSELGVRFSNSMFYAQLTGFRSVNKNIGEATGNTWQQIFLNNTADGVEIDTKWRPLDIFTLDLTGVVQHSDISGVGGSTGFDGNQIDRLPNVELHLTPTLSLPNGRASVYATVSYYGKRWGDLANTLQLDAYTDLEAGVSYKITPTMILSAQGTNLTNKFSITEGNPRGNSVIAGSNAYGFARANLPRAGVIKLDVKF